MSAAPQSREDEAAIAEAASAWLARRDRGLSPAEQDAFLQWCREDPRHRAALARLDQAWAWLDSLAEWRPAHSARPNPDLLARPHPKCTRRPAFLAGALALAASLAVGFLLLRPASSPFASSAGSLRVIPAPERFTLEDGSVVEANRGGVFAPAFSPAERRVRLLEGEAHFTVAKNPARPFVVEVAGLTVRAVGTAFNVRQSAHTVDVLVTEGKVQVESAPLVTGLPPSTAVVTPVAAGEQATVDAAQPASAPVVVTLTPAQIEHSLAWQGVRLDFDGLPLAAVVTEFNLRNRQQLVIGDRRVADLRVAGSFRAENVEAFARLLEASFGITVERRIDGALVLRRRE